MTCANPSLMVGRESAGRDHAVDMRMEQQVLSPCVEDGEEADLGAQMFRVGGHLQQRLRAGCEQQVVECDAGWCSARTFSSWGTVKTTWK